MEILDFISQHLIFLLESILETELCEEPFVLSALVAILKAHTDLETSLLSLDWILKVFNAEFTIECDFWNTVTCWHKMVVVDELNKSRVKLDCIAKKCLKINQQD